MSRCLASIVIPTFKRPDMLRQLLQSIAPLPPCTQVIVVNDGTDAVAGYADVVAWASQSFQDFSYIVLPENSGAPAARNAGIRVAKGDWVALVDDDDEWLPGKLQAQLDLVTGALPQLGLVYCWTRVLGHRGELDTVSRPQIEGAAASAIMRTNFILSPSVLVRRSAFDDVGMFDEALPSCQDWDMWARILCGGYTCGVVKQELAIYHRHGGASVGLSTRAQRGYVMFLRKHWRQVLRHTGPINWARKAALYVRLSRQGI